MEQTRWRAAAFVMPASLVTITFLVLPLLLLFRYSLNSFVPGQFMVDALTLANYGQAFVDPYYRNVLAKTIVMAALVTVLCILLGLPIAQFLARTQSRFKSLLLLCIIVPLFVGNAVRAAGWMVAFGQQGLVNQLGLATGVLNAPVWKTSSAASCSACRWAAMSATPTTPRPTRTTWTPSWRCWSRRA